MERPTPTSFDKVSVIGRGAYGKVCASSAPPPPPSLRAPPPSRAVGTNGQPYLGDFVARLFCPVTSAYTGPPLLPLPLPRPRPPPFLRDIMLRYSAGTTRPG